jgi:hypothetical protein
MVLLNLGSHLSLIDSITIEGIGGHATKEKPKKKPKYLPHRRNTLMKKEANHLWRAKV